MKPVLLKMESFGSYRDETIDFTNKDHGIFLITGDTVIRLVYDESSDNQHF